VQSHTLFRELVVPEIVKKTSLSCLVIDNLRTTSGKPLKVKYLTTINWKRSPLFLYSSGDPICSKRDFSGLTPLEMEKQFPQYWKNDPEEGGKPI
jgi:hypothetical protein